MISQLHFFANAFTRFFVLPFLPPPRKSESYGDFSISYEEMQKTEKDLPFS